MKFEKSELRLVPGTKSEQNEQCISSENFLEQINNEQLLEIENPEKSICHQIAYTEIIPEISTSEEYVIFVGGFGSNALAYDAQLLELAQRGRKVLYLNPLEGIEGSVGDRFYANEKNVPETLQNKAFEVSRFFEIKGIERADIVGHSQGGAVAALVTATNPGRINKLILDTPAGLVGQKSKSEFLLRAAEEGLSEYFYARKKLKNENDNSFIDEWKARLFHDKRANMSRLLWRMRNEIQSLATTDITPLLEDIQKGINQDDIEGSSPEVILLTAQNDRIFRSEEIQETLGQNPVAETYPDGTKTGLINSWAMYADKNTGHGFLTKNDPKLLVQLVEQQKFKNKGSNAEIIADFITGKHNQAVAA